MLNVEVYPVATKSSLDRLLRRFGRVGLALHDDYMIGWEADKLTHSDYSKRSGSYIRLAVFIDNGIYVVEFSSVSIAGQGPPDVSIESDPKTLRADPTFQKVFGILPVVFRDRDLA